MLLCPWAYWEFLDRILGTMNFGPQFRSYIKSIYHDIRSAIISNGYVSEFFQVQRGVRQGARYLHCCLSWWRKCLDKRFESVQKYRDCVCLERGKEVKISQYADDNTCIVTNSYGLVKVIDVFNEYGRASGAKLNTTKSKGLWLGRWRSRTDSPCGLTWVNTSLKNGGIYFGSENAKIQSWEEVTAKFKGILKKWEPRYLTLRGKMTVIGSLVASTLWHVVKMYPLTRECIDSLQSEIWKFVWSKKQEWVRRETCMSEYFTTFLFSEIETTNNQSKR